MSLADSFEGEFGVIGLYFEFAAAAGEGDESPLPVAVQAVLGSCAHSSPFVAVVARGALLAVHVEFALFSALFTGALWRKIYELKCIIFLKTVSKL